MPAPHSDLFALGCKAVLKSSLDWLFNDEQVEPLTAQPPQALQIRHDATQRPVPRFCGGRQGREVQRPNPPTEWARWRAGVGRGACGSLAGAPERVPCCPAEAGW